MRSSTVLSLPLQLVFLAQSVTSRYWTQGGDKRTSLFFRSVSEKDRKVYNLDDSMSVYRRKWSRAWSTLNTSWISATWSKCYKTFYKRYLPILSVFSWQPWLESLASGKHTNYTQITKVRKITDENSFITLAPGPSVIKNTDVIYQFS